MLFKYSLYRISNYFHASGVVLLECVQLAVDVDNDHINGLMLFESLGQVFSHYLVCNRNGWAKVFWVWHHNIITNLDPPLLEFGHAVPPNEFACVQLDEQRFMFSFTRDPKEGLPLSETMGKLKGEVRLTHFGRA